MKPEAIKRLPIVATALIVLVVGGLAVRKALNPALYTNQARIDSYYHPKASILGDAIAAERRGDYATALRQFRCLADQGDANAEFQLGAMYLSGSGVPQDYVIAQKWLNLAAAGGDEEAIKYREMIAPRMTPAQIAEAQKLAREWKPKLER